MTLPRLALLVVAAAIVGCSEPPVVTVTNHSDFALEHLVISGSGFSEDLGSLSAGAERSFSPKPHGESGIRVAFDALGQHHNSPAEAGYFEASGGYRVSVVIDPKFDIKVDSRLK